MTAVPEHFYSGIALTGAGATIKGICRSICPLKKINAVFYLEQQPPEPQDPPSASSPPPQPEPQPQPPPLPYVGSSSCGCTSKPPSDMNMFTLLTCSSKALSIQKVKPPSSTTLSCALGSSRARASLAPPQPPPRNMRMGLFSLSAKKLSNCCFASSCK